MVGDRIFFFLLCFVISAFELEPQKYAKLFKFDNPKQQPIPYQSEIWIWALDEKMKPKR